MADTDSTYTRKQDIIHLDVGGTPFRMLRSTAMRYPQSLLARLLGEFPNAGEANEPLFIDRSPKAFAWILEIYRDGDYLKCVPEMSRDLLRKELDFYELPIQPALDVEAREASIPPAETPPHLDWDEGLRFSDIVDEVKRRGLCRFRSFDVFSYIRFDDGEPGSRHRLYISSSPIVYCRLPGDSEEDGQFEAALHGTRPAYTREKHSSGIYVARCGDLNEWEEREDEREKPGFVVETFDEESMDRLQAEAAQYKASVYQRKKNLKTFRKNLRISYLEVDRN